MAKEEMLKFNGKVIECLPNATFKVKLENNHVLLAYVGGKIRKHEINVANGDNVELEVSPYDLNRGRIVYRTR